MKVIEQTVWQNQEDNFNKILAVLPSIDSTEAQSLETQTEECIKKASIAIQRHPNSKWLDDSYVLVGKARFYRLEYQDAVETFKYVNTRSKERHARHQALINLMRTFVEKEEYNNADAVSDYLRKEKISRSNLKELHLTRAFLAQKREDYNNMVRHLVLAAPIAKKSERKARIYFIIGQIYQKLGFDAQAYNNYGLCLKSNPDFDLAFYARLYRAQVVELSDQSDVKRVNKYFVKLLKDRKNAEFKDKIYYEMGQFEYKQGHIRAAIERFKTSVVNSTKNRRQKAYSYLRLGQIYFDDLAEYELAKAYYDSVLIELPKDEENYEQIEQRQRVLDNFVEQIKTIKLQDSLLALAALDTSTLSTMFDNMLEQERIEEEKKAEKAKKEQERRERLVSEDERGFDIKSEGTWYFYNESAISQGISEFNKIWGRRPLEDNWRRSTKSVLVSTSKPPPDEPQDQGENKIDEGELKNNDSEKKKEWFASIPFTDEQKQQANGLIETALYNLGNIYHFDLEEEENAIETYITLKTRYPESKYIAEVLYLLYLIYQDIDPEKSELYKTQLLENYPESEFALSIVNPNYKQLSRLANQKVKRAYEAAYEFFDQGMYDTAAYILKNTMREYPEDPFLDRLDLLQVMIAGKTEGLSSYQFRLDEFLTKYTESELLPYAKDLRAISDEIQKEINRRRGIVYQLNDQLKHSFVMVYKNSNETFNQSVIGNFESFIDTLNFQNTVVTNLVYEDNSALLLIDGFKDKDEALSFYALFVKSKEFTEKVKEVRISDFVASKPNFETFYTNKDLRGYERFFKNHYYY
jgi:tetratricopeptide (TPR) repeat protein